ncbi:MAG: hypothetical protein GWP59_04190 [Chlamydiales bacterium]|nr:hypothetical protein [Chlamydiales bacterium]
MKIISFILINSLLILSILYALLKYDSQSSIHFGALDYNIVIDSQNLSCLKKFPLKQKEALMSMQEKDLQAISLQLLSSKQYYPKNSRIDLKLLKADPVYYSGYFKGVLLKLYGPYLRTKNEEDFFKKDIELLFTTFLNKKDKAFSFYDLIGEVKNKQISKRFSHSINPYYNSFTLPPLSSFIYISQKDQEKICLYNTSERVISALFGKSLGSNIINKMAELHTLLYQKKGPKFKIDFYKYIKSLPISPKIIETIDCSKGSNRTQDKTIILYRKNTTSIYCVFILP